ncbi:hypothetical protein [uncultured Polaribacter sp.]|uniref:hypothetical protein n=1 Tax=uncultured Polaribacter sp. TaxID=174711 RepID=UPI0026244EF8|nr:hypothetical protein [uncultured Polaribacter sp.]
MLKKATNLFSLKIILFSLLIIFFSACSKTDPEEFIEEEEGDDEVVEAVEPVNEADFYIEPSSFAVEKNLVTDYGADIIFSTDDSTILQTAIDDVNSLGGGKLIIPEGNFTFEDINLKSNVHLRISDQAVIKPMATGTRGYVIFRVTNDTSSTPLENVSIIGTGGGKFTVDLRDAQNDKVRVIQSWNVKNFKYSNILVQDKKSIFAAVEFNGVEIGDKVYGPRFGVVSNIDLIDSHYGYGVVQLQLGREIYFNNLYGKGGITLRIETHNKTLYDASKYVAPDNLFGRDIRSENGNCAVMLSPHFVKIGKADIGIIKSVGSGYAVRVEKGFVTAKEQQDSNVTLTDGSFSTETLIRNVEVTYLDNTAQIKNKDFKFMPCNIRPEQYEYTNEPGFTFDTYIYEQVASIGGGKNVANYTIDFNPNQITVINSSNSGGRKAFIEEDDTINCN